MARTRPAKQPDTGTHLPIGGLTALRGLAALYVASFHHLNNLGVPVYLRGGYLAVDFFFLLSGFILMHAYSKAFSKKPSRKNYSSFLVLRLGRIYPAHLLGMLLVFTVSVFLQGNPLRLSLSSFFANLFLVQAWGFFNNLTWNKPAWSLSAEWACYLLFPFLCWMLKNLTAVKKIILYGLCIIALQAVVFLHPTHSLNVTYDSLSLLRAMSEFLQGMLLYYFFHSGHRRIPADMAMILSAMVLLFIILPYHTHLQPLIVLPMALIILTAAQNSGISGFILNSRPFVFLGNISLSIYILHLPVHLLLMNYTKFLLFITPKEWSFLAVLLNVVLYYGTLILFSWYVYERLERRVRDRVRKRFHVK